MTSLKKDLCFREHNSIFWDFLFTTTIFKHLFGRQTFVKVKLQYDYIGLFVHSYSKLYCTSIIASGAYIHSQHIQSLTNQLRTFLNAVSKAITEDTNYVAVWGIALKKAPINRSVPIIVVRCPYIYWAYQHTWKAMVTKCSRYVPIYQQICKSSRKHLHTREAPWRSFHKIWNHKKLPRSINIGHTWNGL